MAKRGGCRDEGTTELEDVGEEKMWAIREHRRLLTHRTIGASRDNVAERSQRHMLQWNESSPSWTSCGHRAAYDIAFHAEVQALWSTRIERMSRQGSERADGCRAYKRARFLMIGGPADRWSCR